MVEEMHEGGRDAWWRTRRHIEKTHGEGEEGVWRRCMVEVDEMHGKDA